MKFLLPFLFFIGCASATEQLSYKVLRTDGAMEVRQYDSYLTASVVFKTKEEMDQQGFRLLADYIFGNNISMTSPVLSSGEDIGMTAPVLTEGEDIGMTAPVFTQANIYKMTFVMPARYTRSTLPRPNNNKVIIEEIPQKKMAAIRFNGRRSQQRNAKFAKDLQIWITNDGMEVLSGPIYAGYNPPWTLPAMRRNEVLFEVK